VKRILFFCYSFVLMNLAAVAGLYYFATRKKELWSTNSCVHQRERWRRLR
jgi:hypothetical protein